MKTFTETAVFICISRGKIVKRIFLPLYSCSELEIDVPAVSQVHH